MTDRANGREWVGLGIYVLIVAMFFFCAAPSEGMNMFRLSNNNEAVKKAEGIGYAYENLLNKATDVLDLGFEAVFDEIGNKTPEFFAASDKLFNNASREFIEDVEEGQNKSMLDRKINEIKERAESKIKGAIMVRIEGTAKFVGDKLKRFIGGADETEVDLRAALAVNQSDDSERKLYESKNGILNSKPLPKVTPSSLASDVAYEATSRGAGLANEKVSTGNAGAQLKDCFSIVEASQSRKSALQFCCLGTYDDKKINSLGWMWNESINMFVDRSKCNRAKLRETFIEKLKKEEAENAAREREQILKDEQEAERLKAHDEHQIQAEKLRTITDREKADSTWHAEKLNAIGYRENQERQLQAEKLRTIRARESANTAKHTEQLNAIRDLENQNARIYSRAGRHSSSNNRSGCKSRPQKAQAALDNYYTRIRSGKINSCAAFNAFMADLDSSLCLDEQMKRQVRRHVASTRASLCSR